MTKVRALNHIHQHIGSLVIERSHGTVFESFDDQDALVQAAAAGLIEILEPMPPKRHTAKNRETK